MNAPRIAVVIPCYRVQSKILDVVARIEADVDAIYVVDDACPLRVGDLVEKEVRDPRVRVIRRAHNGGVGAATMTGMAAAAADGADILVKIDGDGQMDPALIPSLVRPLLRAEADYAKGTRFFSPEYLADMPVIRLLGNSALSLLAKLSSGYWNIMDPTNGFIAMHATIFRLLPHGKIAERFFFESDMLFRVNLLRAQVVDVPMRASYGGEFSNLRIHHVILPFIWYHLRNAAKRIAYSYFLRDFSVGSLYLVFGIPAVLFGIIFGAYEWIVSAQTDVVASAGTVMLAALPLVMGFQLLLSFLAFDISNVPRLPLHIRLSESASPALNQNADAASSDAPAEPGADRTARQPSLGDR
jgi:glycosyltransferase involved in cell wall biosynthesis